MDWQTLRSVLAVAGEGSVRRAARHLGVSHSTVLRHVSQLEDSLGTRLFDRGERGYDVTPAGQLVFETSREVEQLLLAMQRRIQGQDLRLSGPASVTMPASMLPILLPDVQRIRDKHPGIDITLDTGTDFANLARREADIALRISNDPLEDLVGRRLCPATVGVYGSCAYLDGVDPALPIAEQRWVGYAEDSPLVFARWMREHMPDATIAVRMSRIEPLRDAVHAGLGVALFPSALGEIESQWRRIADAPQLTTWLWLLTHRDLRTTARLRILRDLFADAVVAKRDIIGATM
jgi:DNA-binding transcriptional LysR family regulator